MKKAMFALVLVMALVAFVGGGVAFALITTGYDTAAELEAYSQSAAPGQVVYAFANFNAGVLGVGAGTTTYSSTNVGTAAFDTVYITTTASSVEVQAFNGLSAVWSANVSGGFSGLGSSVLATGNYNPNNEPVNAGPNAILVPNPNPPPARIWLSLGKRYVSQTFENGDLPISSIITGFKTGDGSAITAFETKAVGDEIVPTPELPIGMLVPLGAVLLAGVLWMRRRQTVKA